MQEEHYSTNTLFLAAHVRRCYKKIRIYLPYFCVLKQTIGRTRKAHHSARVSNRLQLLYYLLGRTDRICWYTHYVNAEQTRVQRNHLPVQ